MDNLVSMLALKLRGNEILPCIRILRGVDIASRQYNATFHYVASYSYLSGGVQVNTTPVAVPITSTTLHMALDTMWFDLDGPSSTLPQPPDDGTQFTANVKLTIVQTNGETIDSSLLDTSTHTPTRI